MKKPLKLDLRKHRPKRPKRQTECLNLRVSPEDKARISELAQAEGVSVTELIRRRVLGGGQ